MRAATLHAPFDVRLEQAPDPKVAGPRDAVVRVLASCICGSDLWPYRGDPAPKEPRRMGHEFVGVVEETGDEVSGVRAGDLVVAPFVWSDGTCAYCARGLQTSCVAGGGYGFPDRSGALVDAGQGDAVRVPEADGTLVPVPAEAAERAAAGGGMLAALLSLSDVMGTGHHAALAARVGPGATVAVVGDGAVGLCGVLAARRLGAERVVAFSRHPARQEVARRFGATDVVQERGEDGARAVVDLLDGVGPDAVLECVGSAESMRQALATVRDGGAVGFVGVPHGVELPVREMFGRNVSVGGGVAPVRAYLPELLADVVAGTLDPSPVFDVELPLDEVAEGYRAMHERRAIKVLLRP